MPYFRYKAVNAAGEIVEGEIEALDQPFVIRRLQDDGCTPLSADEVGSAAGGMWFHRRLGRRKLAVGDIAVMSNEMGTLVRAGLPIDRALTVLASLVDKPASQAFVSQTLEKVRSGATLAEALEQQTELLPSYYVGMVRAGEASNSLGTIFARLGQLLTRTRAVRERVKSALLYPIIVLVVAGFTIAVLLTVVVPQFRPLFESAGAALPWPTRIVIAAGDIVREFWWACLLVPIAMASAVWYHYQQASGRAFWDGALLKLPIVGALILKLDVARFTRTLGTLLENGVAELNALSIATSTVTNRAVSNALSGVSVRLRRGDGWSAPLRDTKAFPNLAVQLIQVGEESGQLDAMLIQAGEIFDDEAERTLERLLTLLVPLITIVLGLVVAAIIGAMLMAILSTYSIPM